MSMLDVARCLSYSKSLDLSPERDRYFNLSMVNSGHLFSCLYSDRTHWCFGREVGDRKVQRSARGNEV